jgi:hypothetical protein
MEHSNHKESEEQNQNANEKFTIEYPLNYNEIVDRKLKMLEQEYADTHKCNFKLEELNDEQDQDSEDEQQIPNLHQDEKNPEIEEKEPVHREENNYYECLQENEDDEGFIEVSEECKNESNYIDDSIKNHREVETFEFCETVDIDIIQQEEPENTQKKKLEPIQNAEKIKEAMKSINMNPPRWAQKYVFYMKNNINDSKLT